MSQQKQRLLEAPSRGDQVQLGSPLGIGHGDLSPLFDEFGWVQGHPEEVINLGNQRSPTSLVWRGMYHKAKVPEDLCRAPFTDSHVDGSVLEAVFRGRHSRHWRQKGNRDRRSHNRDRHALRLRILILPQWTAIERFLIRVVELETTFPWGVVRDARDQDVDPDIPGVLFPVVSADSPNVQVSPQQIGIWHGNGNQITPIDGYTGPLLGCVLRRTFLYPLAETGFP